MSTIDINSGKLVEWIMTRLKVSKDWSEKISNIRQKITNALLDMPESEEIKQIIIGTYINYYHCLRILEILKKMEGNTRNIFGQYSSKKIKDWQEIVRLYEQGYLYLMDCAQILNQNICFEVPAVKKAIEKNNKTMTDSSRREKDCITTVHEASANLKRLCATYNIDLDPHRDAGSDDIRAQLRQSTSGVGPLISKLEDEVATLKVPFELYKRYVKATVKEDEKVCPLIEYLLEHGNKTVHEWRHGEPPILASANEVVDEPVSGQAGDEISWDVEIDDLEVEDGFSVVDFGIEVEGDHSGVRENETRTLIEDLDTRELLLDDLCELAEFFTSCIDETKTRTGSFLDTIEAADSSRPSIATDAASGCQGAVAAFCTLLADRGLVHLLMMASSPAYLESIVARLERERATVVKYRNLEALLRTRAAEAALDSGLQEERLAGLRIQCRDLKARLEAAIATALGDRAVRLVGEIATVL